MLTIPRILYHSLRSKNTKVCKTKLKVFYKSQLFLQSRMLAPNRPDLPFKTCRQLLGPMISYNIHTCPHSKTFLQHIRDNIYRKRQYQILMKNTTKPRKGMFLRCRMRIPQDKIHIAVALWSNNKFQNQRLQSQSQTMTSKSVRSRHMMALISH